MTYEYKIMTYEYRILAFSNYDGDSFDLTLDLGFDLVLHRQCQIAGVDTPELRGGTDESNAAGLLARDEARDLVRDWMLDEDTNAVFVSENYTGKFGRPLGDIRCQRTNESLRKYLLENRLGVAYDGQKKAEVQAAHNDNIAYLIKTGRI